MCELYIHFYFSFSFCCLWVCFRMEIGHSPSKNAMTYISICVHTHISIWSHPSSVYLGICQFTFPQSHGHKILTFILLFTSFMYVYLQAYVILLLCFIAFRSGSYISILSVKWTVVSNDRHSPPLSFLFFHVDKCARGTVIMLFGSL